MHEAPPGQLGANIGHAGERGAGLGWAGLGRGRAAQAAVTGRWRKKGWGPTRGVRASVFLPIRFYRGGRGPRPPPARTHHGPGAAIFVSPRRGGQKGKKGKKIDACRI